MKLSLAHIYVQNFWSGGSILKTAKKKNGEFFGSSKAMDIILVTPYSRAENYWYVILIGKHCFELFNSIIQCGKG